MSNESIIVDSIFKEFVVKRGNVQSKSVAINNVSFSVLRGEVFGIIGRNGSGKSTLLKLISNIMYPDTGTISVFGKVASVLELGMGFHSDLTGRENIRLKCGMFGFSDKQIDDFIEDIVQFSELGDRIDDPIRTYSSGMTAKLAFSVLINVNCDIMILDEILSVGDAGFNAKCKCIFDKLKSQGKTIIIASHSIPTIEKMCDRALWIDCGQVHEIGDPDVVCYNYTRSITESFEVVQNLAMAGNVESQNRLGEMYKKGICVDKNYEMAIEWFNKAANQGFCPALINLGDLLEEEGKVEDAKKQYSIALMHGNPEAALKLNFLNQDKDSFSVDAVQKLKDMAEHGNSRAMFFYADTLQKGTCVKRDDYNSFYWFNEAFKAGEVNSAYRIAVMYREGIGTDKNMECAEKFFKNSFDSGNIHAAIDIANMYRFGKIIKKDMQKCMYWYKQAALRGNTDAMMQLGLLYGDESAEYYDRDLSSKWLNLYSEANNSALNHLYSDLALKTVEFDKNMDDIFDSLISAANFGFVQSQFQLGIMYRDGIGTLPDSSKAASWFKKGADSNHLQSQLELSQMYLKGNGVERNLDLAFKYLNDAEKTGNFVIRYFLGVCYRDGIGVKKDPDMAYLLFKQSSEYGYPNAISALKEIQNEKHN